MGRGRNYSLGVHLSSGSEALAHLRSSLEFRAQAPSPAWLLGGLLPSNRASPSLRALT